MEKAKGVRAKGGGKSPVVVQDDRPGVKTLSEMGITKDQSSKWQKLAQVPPKAVDDPGQRW